MHGMFRVDDQHCDHPGGYSSGTGGPNEGSRHLCLLLCHDGQSVCTVTLYIVLACVCKSCVYI